MMHSNVRLRQRVLVLAAFLATGVAVRAAPPAAPPPPKEYKVHVRYRIRAVGNGRVAQFLNMVRYLESLGLTKDPGPENEVEDPDQTLLNGTIASDRVYKLLTERHVLALLLIPAGYELPTEGDRPVKVQLELKSGLPLERQRLLADQTRELLTGSGFRESIGYDHRGHSRLVGLIPTANLDQLLEDLRWQGSGWLMPSVPPTQLPLPIRNLWPVLTAEVLPEPPGFPPAKQVASAPPGPAETDDLVKIAPDLRALLKESTPRRIELLLVAAPPEYDTRWRRDLTQAAPGLSVQGQLGQLITVRVGPDKLATLAKQPSIRALRLPRPAIPQYVSPTITGSQIQEALKVSGVEQLHKEGHRGKGVRVAVVDGDFRGYQQFVGSQLPASTHLVDLTAECEPAIEPRNYPESGPPLGHGTQVALALALAAPDVDLTLVRIDPEAPYQLLAAARYINGDGVRSPSLEERNEELVEAAAQLQSRRDQLLAERKQVLENFGQDKASEDLRQAHFKKQAQLEKDELELERRQQRYLDLASAFIKLKGIRVVACGLTWDEGYPADGGSALSRHFDDRPFRAAGWFQSVGNTQGQSWGGLFRDGDGNGVMEFAAPETPLPANRWTRELNFLGWQPLAGQVAADLPKTRLRMSIQWREPHDPMFASPNTDAYRVPLANLRLLVLRQRDPSGAKLPADDLEVVARSTGLPLRLDESPTSATYEQTLEFVVDTPGRYALRLEGQVPHSLRPSKEPTLPSLEVIWELKPRLFLNVVDEAAREAGRVVFLDFPSAQGGLGMPADAHQVGSVGAATLAGKLESFTVRGSVLNQQLRREPKVLAFPLLPPGLPDLKLSIGSALATGFAAGTAALRLPEPAPADVLKEQLQLPRR